MLLYGSFKFIQIADKHNSDRAIYLFIMATWGQKHNNTYNNESKNTV